jgi:hypothetical protein
MNPLVELLILIVLISYLAGLAFAVGVWLVLDWRDRRKATASFPKRKKKFNDPLEEE